MFLKVHYVSELRALTNTLTREAQIYSIFSIRDNAWRGKSSQ